MGQRFLTSVSNLFETQRELGAPGCLSPKARVALCPAAERVPEMLCQIEDLETIPLAGWCPGNRRQRGSGLLKSPAEAAGLLRRGVGAQRERRDALSAGLGAGGVAPLPSRGPGAWVARGDTREAASPAHSSPPPALGGGSDGVGVTERDCPPPLLPRRGSAIKAPCAPLSAPGLPTPALGDAHPTAELSPPSHTCPPATVSATTLWAGDGNRGLGRSWGAYLGRGASSERSPNSVPTRACLERALRSSHSSAPSSFGSFSTLGYLGREDRREQLPTLGGGRRRGDAWRETLGGDLPGRTPLMGEPCASRKSPRCLSGSWRTYLECAGPGASFPQLAPKLPLPWASQPWRWRSPSRRGRGEETFLLRPGVWRRGLTNKRDPPKSQCES